MKEYNNELDKKIEFFLYEMGLEIRNEEDMHSKYVSKSYYSKHTYNTFTDLLERFDYEVEELIYFFTSQAYGAYFIQGEDGSNMTKSELNNLIINLVNKEINAKEDFLNKTFERYLKNEPYCKEEVEIIVYELDRIAPKYNLLTFSDEYRQINIMDIVQKAFTLFVEEGK